MRLRLLVGSLCLFMWANMAAAAPFAYIANSGNSTVSVVDLNGNSIVTTIGMVAGSFPYGVAVNPSGTLVYVSCPPQQRGSLGQPGVTASVAVINAATNTLVTGVMPSINYEPSGLAVNSAETRLYVADWTNGAVHVYDLTTSPYTEISGSPISVGGASAQPEGVALSPNGASLYVADSGINTVSVISTASNTKTSDIVLTNVSPLGLVASPDGTRLYVSNTAGSQIALVTLPSTITYITTASNATSNSIAIDPIAAPASVYTDLFGTNQVGVVNYSTNAVTTQANSSQTGPWGVAVNAADTKLVVTNNQGVDASGGSTGSVSIFTLPSLGTPTVVPLSAGSLPTTLGNFIGPEMVAINATANVGGSISPSGSVNVAVGKSKTFTVTPDGTHRILGVVIDTNTPLLPPQLVYAGTSYTFSNVTAAHTIAASFQQIYPVQIVSSGTGSGTFTWSSSNSPISGSCGTNCKTFDSGANVSITATANPGSTFGGWNSTFCSSIGGTNGEICNVNALSVSKTIMPTFSGQSSTDVRIVDAGGNFMAFYTDISSAVAAANATEKVQLTTSAAAQNVVINKGVAITLQGGFASGFASGGSMTDITSLTVSSGTVTIDGIQIH